MKFKINKAAYDALSPEFQSEYEAGEKDGEYVLTIEGQPAAEDTGPLKRSLDNERNRHKETKRLLDEAKATIDGFEDVEALKTAHGKEVGKLKTFAETTLKTNKATELATKISNSPKLMLPHILDRLEVDMSGDEPKLSIKDKDGKVSADMTIEKLGAELVANPDFKAIVIASKASGGGAPKLATAKPLGGGAPKDGNEGGDTFNPSQAKPADLAARITARREARAAEAGA